MGNFIYKKIELSDTENMNQIYQLRFQVYGRECGFVKEEDYPDGLEIDNYDKQSVHFAAMGDDGNVIATMRMILKGKLPLPVEKYFSAIREKNLSTGQVPVEISRLVISKRLRRRKNDKLYYEPNLQDPEVVDDTPGGFLRRANPMIFGLYREMYQESKRTGITHWYSLMEESLWSLLQLHGFDFECIGEEVDIYGPVKPYVADILKIEQKVSTMYPKLFTYFTDGLNQPQVPQQG